MTIAYAVESGAVHGRLTQDPDPVFRPFDAGQALREERRWISWIWAITSWRKSNCQ